MVNGWTILAHPLFLDAMERLVRAVEKERRKDPDGSPGPNTKLLAHILDLALVKIPSDPGGAQFRHGGSLGGEGRHWFRAKTGGGRYRLFYRFHSAARIIVLAWVNDAESLRAYESRTDVYRVFAAMLESGNPPDTWELLLDAAADVPSITRLRKLLGLPSDPPGS